MKTACFALLLVALANGWAADISVGGVSVAVPNPHGFSPVTEKMVAVNDQLILFVPPTSEQLLAFIPDVDVPAALRGEIPQMERRFVVQTLRGIVSLFLSGTEFQELKAVAKSQNAKIIENAERKLPGITQEINKGISDKYDVDLAFSVSQILPMPVHEESDRTLAYSAFVRFEMNDEFGNLTSNVAVVTATFVHVRGKLLLLFAYAEESGLEWSKETSRQWADSIVAANPPDAQTGMKEEQPSAVFRVD